MKIVIIGYSGSGKSTLTKMLGAHYNIPILHLDSIHFKEGWVERDNLEFNQIVLDFMKNNESWVIDGNYRKIGLERFQEADQLIFLNYNRFFCLNSVIKRYFQNKGKTRSDMAEGCEEKLDLSFLWWVFAKGRNKSRRTQLENLAKNHKNALIFNSRKQLFQYYRQNNIKNIIENN